MNSTTLTIGSLNIKYSVKIPGARGDFKKFAKQSGAQIVGLQEFGYEVRDEFFDHGNEGWSWFRDDENHETGQNPIAWRSLLFDFLDAEIIDLDKDGFFRPGGDKAVRTRGTLVVLRHRETRRIVRHLNTHTPSAVQRGERPNMSVENRIASLEDCLRTIKKIESKVPAKDLFHVTGDFNWDSAADKWKGTPENRLAPRLVSQYDVLGESEGKEPGSHGTRDIDYVFIRKGNIQKFVDADVVTGLLSDHNGAWARTVVEAL